MIRKYPSLLICLALAFMAFYGLLKGVDTGETGRIIFGATGFLLFSLLPGTLLIVKTTAK